MKTLKTLLALFALVAVSSTAAFAQVSDNVTVTADALAAITVDTQNDIDLGFIQAGTQSTLDPNAGTNNVNVGQNFTIGEVLIDGEPGQEVHITYTNATLEHDTEADETFTTTAYSGASSFTSGNTLTLDVTTGELTIFFGGSTDADGLPAGNWTSPTNVITVTVNYN